MFIYTCIYAWVCMRERHIYIYIYILTLYATVWYRNNLTSDGHAPIREVAFKQAGAYSFLAFHRICILFQSLCFWHLCYLFFGSNNHLLAGKQHFLTRDLSDIILAVEVEDH